MHHEQEYGPTEVLLGISPAIRRVNELIRKAATSEVPVLISGESGTGKELAARLLHRLSARSQHKFLKVNCPAIPNAIFESELFGPHLARGIGAQSKAERFEQADQGTLFLDEIGELDFTLQAKLLHALEDFKVVRLGAIEESRMDVRLICATSRDLEAEVAKGNFRVDLFYRINVLPIKMPALRERTSDVPILMNHFVRRHSERVCGLRRPISSSFLSVLESYHWPGNIRELENLARRYVIAGDEEQIIAALRDPSGMLSPAADLVDLSTPLRVQTKRAVQRLERKIIMGVLQAHQWNRRKTARSLDISYRALLYKIKEAGLPSLRAAKAAIEETPY